jgi:hypothetical protein
MKLTNETLTILKNFASINQNIEFKEGSEIATMAPSKTVIAKATLNVEFPQSFCVYDLNEFLSVANMYKDSLELDFDESNIIFKDNSSQIRFRKTEKSNIVTLPENKQITFNDPEISFNLPESVFANIMKSASILSSPHIGIKSNGQDIHGICFSADDSSQHNYDTFICTHSEQLNKFTAVFSTENIKMLPGNYEVEISSNGIAHFKNEKDSVEYWIALEAKHSNFGE